MSTRPRWLSRWLPVAAYMTAIFYLSSLSAAPLPSGVSDVSAHALGYAGLGIVCVRAVAGGLPARVTARAALGAAALAVGYAATDEVHQSFVPGRYADVRDLFADAVGAAFGIGACWAFDIIWRRAAGGRA